MYDAGVAFAAWCNEHGGIQGREVVIDDLDAKLFDYGQRMAEACQQDFALVGGGGVFDSQGIDTRVSCGLPNIAGYIGDAPGGRRGGPAGPAGAQPGLRVPTAPATAGSTRPTRRHELRDHVGQPRRVGHGARAGRRGRGEARLRRRLRRAVPAAIGETGWRGFVQQMRDADVQVFEMIGEPENMVALQSAMQTEGWYPEFTVPAAQLRRREVRRGGRADGSASTYMRSAFPTFDMADEAPAMADYLELMERYNPEGKVALLGAQACRPTCCSPRRPTSAAPTSAGRACSSRPRPRGLDRRRAPRPPDPRQHGRHPLQPDDPGDVRGLRVRRGAHRPNEGFYNCDEKNVIELTGRLRPGAQAGPTGARAGTHGPVPRGHDHRPGHRRDPGGGGQRPGPDLHDDRHLQLRPRRHRHAGAFAYWQVRVDWGWPAPVALLVVLGPLGPLLGLGIERFVMRGLEDGPRRRGRVDRPARRPAWASGCGCGART